MPEKRIEKKVESAVPLYLAAAVWPIAAFALPIYRLWAVGLSALLSVLVWRLGRKLCPPTIVYLPAPEEPIRTGQAATDKMLEKVRKDLALLPQLDDFIEDEPLSACRPPLKSCLHTRGWSSSRAPTPPSCAGR